MAQAIRPIILCDTEYYSDKGWNEDPNPDLPREVVQIGALKLHPDTLDIIDSFEQLVLLSVHDRLPDYFTNLSGITNERLQAEGVPFTAAYQRFSDFIGGGRFASNGKDWQIIKLTQRLNGMAQVDLPDAINLRPWLHQHAPQTVGVVSGNLAQVLGLRLSCNVHTGLADCHSIRDALLHLLGQGAPSPFRD